MNRFILLIAIYAGIVISGCKKVPEYPIAPAGHDKAALIDRTKLHIMYSMNNVPQSQRQGIYLHNYQAPKSAGPVQLASVDEVDNNYIISILDISSTQAVILSEAKNKESYWFWGPYSKDRWIYENGQWLYDEPVDLSKITKEGAKFLD